VVAPVAGKQGSYKARKRVVPIYRNSIGFNISKLSSFLASQPPGKKAFDLL
jgi:hypothetical protein